MALAAALAGFVGGCGEPAENGPVLLPAGTGTGTGVATATSTGTGTGVAAPVVSCPDPSGSGSLGSTCDQTGTINTGVFMIQNNIWNREGGTQCISGHQHPGFVGFDVTAANHAIVDSTPAAYPSVVRGWHWGFQTSGHNMGRQLAAIGSVPSLWCFVTPPGHKYNVAYDIWLHPTDGNLGNTAPTGGMELMIWLAREDPENGVWPIGTAVDRFQWQGSWWRIYEGTTETWSVVTYMRETNTNAVDFDLKFFFDDAVARGFITNSWYLLGVEAGFEIWRGGFGLQSTSYYVDVR